jgi:transposase
MKTGLEEIKPIYVRKERRTRGHVFVCMLAYKIMFHIWKWFKEDKLFPQKYILECLDKINIVEYAFADRTIKLLPKILTEDQQIILNRLNMTLPEKYVGNKFI